MANFQAEIVPLTAPDQVKVKVGKTFVDLNIGDLDDETLSGVISEFAERMMNIAEEQRKAPAGPQKR